MTVDAAAGSNMTILESYATPFPFEKNFRYDDHRQWFAASWETGAIVYVWVAYLFVVYGIQYLMRHREPFQLRTLLFMWNVSLATFSIMATVRTLPEMVNVLSTKGFYHSTCLRWYLDHPVSGFWNHLFVLSKSIELGDTVFIVLRKQPLSFLHVYHHSTVLITTWYGYNDQVAPASWFIVLNYLVHSVMYSYYALKSLRFRLPRFIAMGITVAQMTQMIIAGATVFAAYKYKVAGNECYVGDGIMKLSIFFYFSYLLLFANFFYKAYYARAKKAAAGVSATSGSKGFHLRINLVTGQKVPDKKTNGCIKQD